MKTICGALVLSTLCACGSDAGPPVQEVISFGDSLSDVGSYAPAAGPLGGGKFTTNPGPIWIENVARAYGLTLTANVIGWGAIEVPCAKPDCLAYGQGGARVTADNGIGNEDGARSGALTIPLKTQLDNHLKDHGGFSPTDLVFVLAGANDLFFWAGAVAAKKAGPDMATAAVQQAAGELAAYAGTIHERGAGHLYVMNLPDLTATPYGHTLDDQGKALVGGLVQAFNQQLAAGLDATHDPIQRIDVSGLLADEEANPAKYGLPAGINTLQPACDPNAIKTATMGKVTDGSSLFCSQNTLVEPGADQGHLFADAVHPTTAGHKALSDLILQKLKGDGLR